MTAKSPRLFDPTSQQDIFADAPPVSAAKRLALRTQVVARTPAQKRFSKLLVDIENANLRLRTVNELLDAGRRAFVEHVEPQQRRIDEARRVLALELAKRLISTTKHKGFTAALRRFATDFLGDFLPQWEVQGDAELEPLYQKIFGNLEEADDIDEFDEFDETDETDEFARELLRKMGMPDDLIDSALGRAGGGAANQSPSHGQGSEAEKRPRSKRQLAAEQTAESAKLAVRTLYRQLASSLHPDRARDDAGRAVATERMARANVAYAANDLQALLALQLEAARESDEYLVNETDATVRTWCDALAGQLAEIKAAMGQLERTLHMALGERAAYVNVSKLKLADIERNVMAAAEDARLDVVAIHGDLDALRDDARFVGWLKSVQNDFKNECSAFDDDFGVMILDAMDTYAQASKAASPRRSKRKARL